MAFFSAGKEERRAWHLHGAFGDYQCMCICSLWAFQSPLNMQREKVSGRAIGKNLLRIWPLNTYLSESDSHVSLTVQHFCKPSSSLLIFTWLSIGHSPKYIYQKSGRDVVIWFLVFIYFKWKNSTCHWQQKPDRFGRMDRHVWPGN